jgi:SAM-dependent methyltransferase
MRQPWGKQRSIRYARWVRRVDPIARHLEPDGCVLCLGARTGEEVEAFQHYGFVTIGIDIAPGHKSVAKGDFHALGFDDASFHTVYTNSLDHAHSIERVAREVHRVLIRDGVFVVETGTAFDGIDAGKHLARPQTFESILWDTPDDLLEALGTRFELAARFKNPHADYHTFILRKVTS